MFDQDVDTSFEDVTDSDRSYGAKRSSASNDVLASIRALGTDFLTSPLERGSAHYNNHKAHEAKQALADAKRYLKEHPSRPYAFWEIFNATYGGSRFSTTYPLESNDWTGDLYLGGQLTTPEKLLNELEDRLGTMSPMTSEQFHRKLGGMLEVSGFSPVERYLSSLSPLSPDDWEEWGSLSERLFGASDPMAQVKLSRWLIGAIARVLKPGCQMDSALVLRGKQGAGKTRSLQALFGEYFTTLHAHQATVEQQRVIQQAWCCELGEIEATFRAKDISALKSFLTETKDSYRDLYQNTPVARPRHCVFAGTTNETTFLNDPTGSRRFWVVDLGDHKVPVDWVELNRDNIWSVALWLYQAGEPHWLADNEFELSEKANKAYQNENPWLEPLESLLDELVEMHSNKRTGDRVDVAVKPSDLLTVLGVKPADHGKNTRSFKQALEALGYYQRQIKVKGKPARYYCLPSSEPLPLVFNGVWKSVKDLAA